jgi:hypothetical protein
MLDFASTTLPVSGQDHEPAHVADPLADLLLSAAAIIVIAVIAVLPIMPRQSTPQREASRPLQNEVVFRLGDREVEPFIATERGLIVGHSSPRMIPVDKIFFDQALPGILEEMRKVDKAVVVLIEPNGFETAFQLEAIISRHGPGRMRQVRIDSECQLQRLIASRPVAATCFVGYGEGARDYNISAMTDISANIFALLILILIIMLAARENSAAPRADALQVIDLEKDVASVERSSLSSDELIELLYERRERASSTKIDLLEQEIAISFGGKTEHFGKAENAISRLRQIGSVGSPVGVYVFSHRFYCKISDSLNTFGWPWREISIPGALRASAGGPQGWSAGFSELIAHSSDRLQFRADLARLLRSASQNEHLNQGWNERGVAAQRPEIMINQLGRWLRTALNAISLLGGLIFVACVDIIRTKRVTGGR